MTFAHRLRKLDKAFYNWPALVIAGALFVLWQLGGDIGIISKSLGTPSEVGEVFWRLSSTGELFGHLAVRLYRTLLGFFNVVERKIAPWRVVAQET